MTITYSNNGSTDQTQSGNSNYPAGSPTGVFFLSTEAGNVRQIANRRSTPLGYVFGCRSITYFKLQTTILSLQRLGGIFISVSCRRNSQWAYKKLQ